jgi:dTDP-4-amino-4,6-dideoxygalactose transaminase
MALDIGPGDAVFTTPFTFMASAEAIALVGATPIFVDIEERSFNIDPGKLRTAIAECKARGQFAAKAIIPVDIFGLPADYAAINALAEEEGLFVIEDAAQSFGATLDNRRAGALAQIACTSFFPAKPLGGYGDGGALFTSSADLDELFRSIRVHGQGQDRYEHVRLGVTGRLDAVQAAVLRIKLTIFEEEVAKRQWVADEYDRRMADAGIPLVTPLVTNGRTSAWAQYSVLAADDVARQAFRDRLSAAGIPTAVYYERPLHLQKAFASCGHHSGDMPVSEAISRRIFSLPMHPYLEAGTIEQIAGILRA